MQSINNLREVNINLEYKLESNTKYKKLKKLYDNNSINYKWFEKEYKSFIYIDRVVISFKYQNKGFGTLFYDDLKNCFKDN